MITQYTYQLPEIKKVLDTVKDEESESILEQLAQSMGRPKGGLKMVVYFNRKFVENPSYVKKYSRNMFNLLTDYHKTQADKASQEPTAVMLSEKLDETFAQLQRMMNQYINVMVEERTATIRAQAEMDVQQNAQELSELREYKKRAQSLLQ